MLEGLLNNLVKEYAQGAIGGNASIPGDKQNSVVQAISDSLLSGMKDQVSQGNTAGILDIFSSKTTSIGNPVMNGIQSTVVSMVSQKTGLNSTLVQGVVASVLPSVMGALGQKASNPSDKSVDFNGIFQSIGGSSALGGVDLNSIMNRLDDDNDGFGLDDVVRAVSSNQKGGIMGMLGGLFGK